MSHDLRRALLRYTDLVYRKGWVANHDGNLTCRMGPDRVLATPTALSKGDVKEGDLVVVDGAGTKVSGKRRSFSEMALHLAVYRARRDVGAVVHAHPPYATAMAVAGLGMDQPILAEAVVSIGPRIPLVPFAMPKTPAWVQGVESHAVEYDAVLLQNHGVMTWGTDLEQAFLRMELVEHLAQITHHSMAFGGPKTLDAAQLGPLLESRRKAGLGPVARGVKTAPRPAPVSGAGLNSPQRPSIDRARLVAIITDELKKL
jgi:L-fuculose-phosphate aldolase